MAISIPFNLQHICVNVRVCQSFGEGKINTHTKEEFVRKDEVKGGRLKHILI